MIVSAAAIGSGRASFWQRYWAEFCLFLAIAAAGLVILFQHEIFGRDIQVQRGGDLRKLVFSGYSDQVNQGQSTISTTRPLAWSCTLKPGFSLPYCAYEVVLDGNGAMPGADLANLEALELTFDYKGPPSTFRVNLKNEDPRYSKHGDRGTSKINKAEFSIVPGRNTIKLHPQDFSVAEWWLNINKVSPELGRTQFDNIVAVEFETGLLTANGDYAFSIDSLRLVRSSVGQAQLYLAIVGLLVVCMILYALVRIRRSRDETCERERLEAVARQTLADAKLAAERASEAKSDFLATMSHEIRTPLNAVLGYAQLLERAPLADKEMNAVRVIHRSGNHLLTLITDILDIAKIEAGKLELGRAPCDLRGLVGAAVDMVRPIAEQKGLNLTATVAQDIPNGIEADGKRLRQVLINLLGNAAKFTSEGRVSLGVSQLARDEESVTMRFEVQDTGPGIPADRLESIFRPFEQAGDAEQREGGTGLGLAITRHILGLMQSDIRVESRVGQGSCFSFDVRLPLIGVETAQEPVESTKIGGYAGPTRQVLIVDDVEANRDLLDTFLTQIGFACSQARNGAEAVQRAQAVKPDLILMDLRMSVMDGHDATRIMRLIEPLSAVPIIILSANVEEASVQKAMAAGANDFVSKPVDHGELLRAIARNCRIEWRQAANQAA